MKGLFSSVQDSVSKEELLVLAQVLANSGHRFNFHNVEVSFKLDGCFCDAVLAFSWWKDGWEERQECLEPVQVVDWFGCLEGVCDAWAREVEKLPQKSRSNHKVVEAPESAWVKSFHNDPEFGDLEGRRLHLS